MKCGIDQRTEKLRGRVTNIIPINKLTHKDFIERAQYIHGTIYTYESIYRNMDNKITIRCDNHGIFKVTPRNHLHGLSGCPKCVSSVSKISNLWLDSLGLPDDMDHREVSGLHPDHPRWRVDGYDPDTKTIYEFHGDYWHGNPMIYESNETNPSSKTSYGELYNRTCARRKSFEDLGYIVIEQWETSLE